MRLTSTITFLSVLILGYSLNAQSDYRRDFWEFWTDCDNHYAYFEKQGIDWIAVRDIYMPKTADIENDAQFIRFMETVINELHNGHVSLNTNLPDSNRIIPSGSDIFAVKTADKFFISDVKPDSGAVQCGIAPGMEVVKFNGVAIAEQLENFLPKYATTYNQEMYSYALNMLLAGTHNVHRVITVIENGLKKDFYPDAKKGTTTDKWPVEYKTLNGNIGFIKINNSLGSSSTVLQFDKAIDSLLETRTIILDLTDTPGGGNTMVARAIMSRFTDKELPYQKHVVEEPFGIMRSWVEYVTPRQKTYRGKLVVMVGHWTGSMGEGIAVGFDGMKRAEIVGTKMAGLLGAVYTFTTPYSGISYQIPAERLYHINGTPREDYVPQFLTENSEETLKKAIELAE